MKLFEKYVSILGVSSVFALHKMSNVMEHGLKYFTHFITTNFDVFFVTFVK